MDNVLPDVAQSALVLANAAELTGAIFNRVAGNDISTALNGQTLTKEMVGQMAISSLKRRIENRQ